ncbi:MAG: hypothetical protein ACK5LM_07045 [Lactovum sp.]
MNKFLRFTAGLVIGSVTTAVLYALYQQTEEEMRVNLVEAVREHFLTASSEEIEVVWIFDSPIRDGVFAGGLNYKDGHSISFEIEEHSHQIIKSVTVDF